MSCWKSLLLAVLGATACGDIQGPGGFPVEALARLEVVDGVNGHGNPHFYFLPPLVPSPQTSGVFDKGLRPQVEICELAGAVCVNELASMPYGVGSFGTVRMAASDEAYVVNWQPDGFAIDPTRTYRVRVLVEGTPLGYVDVDFLIGGEGADVERIPLDDARAFPFAFRIEKGAVFLIDARGGTVSTDHETVRLAVPAGSVDQRIGITVMPAPASPAGMGLIDGTVFDFQPDSLEFNLRARLTMAYDESLLAGVDEGELTLLSRVDTRWAEVAGAVVDAESNTVSGFVGGLSSKAIGVAADSVIVSTDAATLVVADTLRITATVVDSSEEVLLNRAVTWWSSDPSVCVVSNGGLVRAMGSGSAVVQASSGSASATIAITVPGPPPASLTLTPDSVRIGVGESVHFTALTLDSLGDTLHLLVDYSILDTTVARTDSSGTVTGIQAGVTGLVASHGSIADTSVVVVYPDPSPPPPSSLVVLPSRVTIGVGDSAQFTTLVLDSLGDTLQVDVNFVTVDVDVATVDPSGLAVGVGPGVTVLVASYGALADSSVVEVQAGPPPPPPSPGSLTLLPDSASITVGDSVPFTAQVFDSLGKLLPVVVTFAMQDSAVASVNTNGLVIGVSPGVTRLVASYGTLMDTSVVEVVGTPPPPPAPGSLKLSPDSATIELGDTRLFTAVVLDSIGDTLQVAVNFRILDTTVATVDSVGTVSGMGSGTTHLVATYGTLADSSVVIVFGPPPSSPPQPSSAVEANLAFETSGPGGWPEPARRVSAVTGSPGGTRRANPLRTVMH